MSVQAGGANTGTQSTAIDASRTSAYGHSGQHSQTEGALKAPSQRGIGKTMTYTSTGTNAQGQRVIGSVQVFEKQ